MDAMLRAHVLICGRTGCYKTSLMRFLCTELVRTPHNRLLILDYAGEYAQILEHLPGGVLLRPGSDDFPLGINFLDWAELANNWGQPCSEPDWCAGMDMDESGGVDFGDVAILAEQWLLGASP